MPVRDCSVVIIFVRANAVTMITGKMCDLIHRSALSLPLNLHNASRVLAGHRRLADIWLNSHSLFAETVSSLYQVKCIQLNELNEVLGGAVA